MKTPYQAMPLSFSRTKKSIALALIASALLSACATRPDSVAATYIDDDEYEDYNCKDLKSAYSKLVIKEKETAEQMSSTANKQVVANVLGATLLAATGFGYARTVNNDSYGTYLAKIRGHMESIARQATKIKCDISEAKAATTTEAKADSK